MVTEHIYPTKIQPLSSYLNKIQPSIKNRTVNTEHVLVFDVHKYSLYGNDVMISIMRYSTDLSKVLK